MENDVKECAEDIINVIELVHYSPEFFDFRIHKGCRGQVEYIIKYIQSKYLSEVD